VAQFTELKQLLETSQYRSISISPALETEPVLISPGLDAAELSQALGRIYGEVRTTSVDGKEQFRILLDPEGRRSRVAREKRWVRIDEVLRQRLSAWKSPGPSAEILAERILRFDRERELNSPLFSPEIPSQSFAERLLVYFSPGTLADLPFGLTSNFSSARRSGESAFPQGVAAELARIQALERGVADAVKDRNLSENAKAGLHAALRLANQRETTVVRLQSTNLGIQLRLHRFDESGASVFQGGATLQVNLDLDWSLPDSIPNSVIIGDENLERMRWVQLASPGAVLPRPDQVKMTQWLRDSGSEESLNLLWPELLDKLFSGEKYVVSLPDDLIMPACFLLAKPSLSRSELQAFLASRGVTYEKVGEVHVLSSLDPKAMIERRYLRSAVRQGLDVVLQGVRPTLEAEARLLFRESSGMRVSGIPPVKRCLWYLEPHEPYQDDHSQGLLRLFGGMSPSMWGLLAEGRAVPLSQLPPDAREKWRANANPAPGPRPADGFAHLYAPSQLICSWVREDVPLFRLELEGRRQTLDLEALSNHLAGPEREQIERLSLEYGVGLGSTLRISTSGYQWSERARVDLPREFRSLENLGKLPDEVRTELRQRAAEIARRNEVFRTPTGNPP